MSIGETSPEVLRDVDAGRRVTVRRLLIAAGFEVPLAGRFAALSAAGLLEALNDEDEEIVRTEVLAWCKVREPSDAVDEFARAITELDDPALQIKRWNSSVRSTLISQRLTCSSSPHNQM